MKIYFAHSKTIDYQNLIYTPIKSDQISKTHEFILPHDEKPGESHKNNTRDFYKSLDLMLAEVSDPATGLGIELGWAFDDGTEIFAFYQAGTKPSGSIFAVTKNLIEYTDSADLLEKVREIISNR